MTGFPSATSPMAMMLRSISAEPLGQINDLVPSIHDPDRDLLFPNLQGFETWIAGLERSDLEALIRQQGQARAAGGFQAVRGLRNVAHQRRSLGSSDAQAVAESAALFDEVRLKLLSTCVSRRPDLRAPWFTVHDRGKSVSVVGSAVADLIERQRLDRFDPPSARYLWQASKELDGDSRPTTMIAGAGSSIRGAMAVARDVGYASESDIPSKSQRLYMGDLEPFYLRLESRRAQSLVNLGNDSKNVLAWLNSDRPAAITLAVGTAFFATPRCPDPVIQPDFGVSSFKLPLLLVGFRVLDPTSANWKDYLEGRGGDQKMPIQYLVRNCVDARFGDGGHAWLPQAVFLAQCHEAHGLRWNDDGAAGTVEPFRKPELGE
jgi:hypothetical protein